jgi:nucleoside-diphosphate-sugar epimerase
VLGRALPRLAAGRSAFVLGNPDVPHSWTYVGDVGEVVVAAALTPAAHGRPWHVPTATVLTQRQLLSRAAQIAGYRPARLRAATRPLVGALGLVSGEMRAIGDVLYQFQAPFILDAGDAEQVLGVSATPTDVAIAMAVGLEPAAASAAGGAGDKRDSAGLSPVD